MCKVFSNLEIFVLLNLSEIYSTQLFFLFSQFLLLCVIKKFNKKWFASLVFKIDTIDGIKWVKLNFVAMQQSSAALIDARLKHNER